MGNLPRRYILAAERRFRASEGFYAVWAAPEGPAGSAAVFQRDSLFRVVCLSPASPQQRPTKGRSERLVICSKLVACFHMPPFMCLCWYVGCAVLHGVDNQLAFTVPLELAFRRPEVSSLTMLDALW